MLSAKKLFYQIVNELSRLPIKTVTTASFNSLPYTYSNAAIKSYHTVVDAVLSNPSAQTSDWTVTTANGSMTVSGSIDGSTTLTVKLAKGE